MALADLKAMAKDLWWTTDPASERLWEKVKKAEADGDTVTFDSLQVFDT